MRVTVRETDVAPDILFVKVHDRKVVKNRVHLDLRPADQLVQVDRLMELGARRVDIGQREVSWVVMAETPGLSPSTSSRNRASW